MEQKTCKTRCFEPYRDIFRRLVPSLPENATPLIVYGGGFLLLVMLLAAIDSAPLTTGAVILLFSTAAVLREIKTRSAQRAASVAEALIASDTAAACAYIESANTSRTLPAIWMKNINAGPSEFALLHEREAALFEHKTQRYTLGVGTRIKVGKIPLYLGGGRQFSYEALKATGHGDLYLTNERLVFVSSRKAVSIALPDIIGSDNVDGGLAVYCNKREEPYAFAVANSALWLMLLKLCAHHHFSAPTLPEGFTITAKPSPEPGEVEISISSPTPLAIRK